METYRIFLTGITGFIGNRLAEQLIKDGHEVHAIIRYRAAEDYLTKPHRIEGVKYYTCNLNDHINLRTIIQKVEPEIITHLAAISPVRLSFIHPLEFQQTNYLSTIELVHMSLELKSFTKFIFASTMETYGWQEQRIPFTEELPLNPASPYAVSKAAAEKYIQMAGKAYTLPYLIAKPCNTFGRMRSVRFITEYLITSMLKGEIPQIGSPNAVRDMMYVTDHINAYISAISSSVRSGVFNFGNGSTYTMLELAEIIRGKIGYKGEIKTGFPSNYPDRPVVDPYLSLNSEKAKKYLNWKPKVSIEDGLDLSIQYWKKNIHN
ncbi:MAG: NAD-dependent epimerase/dehydratase family protein [Promethearchaeota archaeon]